MKNDHEVIIFIETNTYLAHKSKCKCSRVNSRQLVDFTNRCHFLVCTINFIRDMPSPTITITVNAYVASKVTKMKKRKSHENTTSPDEIQGNQEVETRLCKKKRIGCFHIKVISHAEKAEYTGCDWFMTLLWFALSIGYIVIGAFHLDKCPAAPMIPVYLLVEGIRLFFAASIYFTKLMFPSMYITFESLSFVVTAFWFIWLIFGSAWIFKHYGMVMDCSAFVLWFAFYHLVLNLFCCGILFIVFVVLICLLTCTNVFESEVVTKNADVV